MLSYYSYCLKSSNFFNHKQIIFNTKKYLNIIRNEVNSPLEIKNSLFKSTLKYFPSEILISQMASIMESILNNYSKPFFTEAQIVTQSFSSLIHPFLSEDEKAKSLMIFKKVFSYSPSLNTIKIAHNFHFHKHI